MSQPSADVKEVLSAAAVVAVCMTIAGIAPLWVTAIGLIVWSMFQGVSFRKKGAL
jgi:hypothetical protein